MRVQISDKLMMIRNNKGLSRANLAKMCDISPKTIQRAEDGNLIKRDSAQRIANALEVDINEIIIQEGLTEEQNRIVNDDSRVVQIIAGPGSGKTKVMVSKVISLLKQGVNPKSIIVFTFTEKAADELNHRIKTEIIKQNINIIGIVDMYIGTIHGFCLHILQDMLGLYKDFNILTPVKNRIFVDKYFSKIGIGQIRKIQKNKKTNEDEFMKKYIHTSKFLDIVSMTEENEVDIERIPNEIKESIKKYKEYLKEYRFFDFTSIMTEAYDQLHSNQQLRRYVEDNIEYLFVDEYQDVNILQEKIISELHILGAKINTVGDLDQSIYSWRGSDPIRFMNFKSRYENTKMMYLNDNFRSTDGVIDVANQCIKNNTQRINDVNIKAVNNNYNTGDIVYKEFKEPELEAEFIVDRITFLNEKLRVPFKEMAILLRTHNLADDIITEMDRRGVPYIIEGVNKLFETSEVKACVNIFKYIVKEIGSKELKDSWKNVYSGIKVSNINKSIQYLDTIDLDNKLYSSLFIQNVFQEFISILDIIQEEGEETKESEKICYNLGKFSQVIDDYETINFRVSPKHRFKSFYKFISSAAQDYYPEGYLENPYIKIDGVRVMTIHQSKGLEFAAVFIPGLSNNKFPHQKVGGLSLWHYLPKESVLDHEKYTEKDIESERRLFFVAITRSKRFLIFTRAIYGRNTKQISEFFKEIKKSYKIIEYVNDNIYINSPIWCNNSKNEKDLIALSFSTFTDYQTCPYKFKISNLFGFKQPITEQMGYGNVMHNIVSDINKMVINKLDIESIDIDTIIEENFHLPYLDSGMFYNNLKNKCVESTNKYYKEVKEDEAILEYAEQKIEVPISDNIILKGRVDLVKKTDNESKKINVYVVDFKTESEESRLAVSSIDAERKSQLLIYAMGYENLTGTKADFIQIHNLDNSNKDTQVINEEDITLLKNEINIATQAIAENNIRKRCNKEKCEVCYVKKLCISNKESDKYGINVDKN